MESVNHSPGDPVPIAAQVVFLVEVFQQGAQIATHTVEAPNALAAINQIEGHYGTPLELEDVLVDQEDSRGHHVMLINNWRGYMFQARALHPVVKKKLALQPEGQTAPASSSDQLCQTHPEDGDPP